MWLLETLKEQSQQCAAVKLLQKQRGKAYRLYRQFAVRLKNDCIYICFLPGFYNSTKIPLHKKTHSN